MNSFSLESYKVCELSQEEQLETEGGWLACLFGALVLCGVMLIGLLTND